MSSNNTYNNNNETIPLASCNTTACRQSYTNNDAAASRLYHDTQSASEDGHQTGGDALKSIIFGGLDGILTSFAIVAGAAGARLKPAVVLTLGVSNILADALSMGVGEFLSGKATNEWILQERAREEWELENYPRGEINEMIEIYKRRGVSHDDAALVIGILSKYKDFFVDLMMQQELELQVPSKDHIQESLREGVVMFLSFTFFGALPLLGYVIIPLCFPHLGEQSLFVCACVVTGVVLFLMGSVKSFFSSLGWFHAGMETLVLGGCCATVAFVVGQWVNSLVGDEGPSKV
jgi:VIT1/CCC1 family predicted Fe2+/Mn2+ transporter